MKRLIAAGIVAAGVSATLSGCSASDATSCQNTITKTDATQVSVWAWYPEFESVVDEFNTTHDDVQVCWTNAGAGSTEYTKFSTAVQAGSGAPDVVMLETQVVPSYIAQGALVNLSEQGADSVRDNYPEGAWADVSRDGAAYAIPVDGGPVAMMYRKDIFDQYGITVPTTWEDYAAAAQQLRDAGSTALMTDFPGNGAAYQQALFAQAGSTPYTLNGATDITIALNDPASTKVMTYWHDLVSKKLVGTEDAFTTDYYTHLMDGTYATVIAASWLPGNLSGFGGEEGVEWRAAPLPQWEGGEPTQVNIGGSTFAVSTQAKDKKAATTVATEIFGTEKAWKLGIEKAALFPLWKPILESPYFADLTSEFFGGQAVNSEVFLPAATDYKGFTFSPFQNFAFDKLIVATNAVNNGELTPEDALATYQKDVTEYAKTQGYTVK